MNRKEAPNGRTAHPHPNARARGLKQNQICETYELDPKIVELKRKYQLDKPQPSLVHTGHRPSSSLRQQQVLRKLENIKQELQSIPDWQNHARSILFDDSSSGKVRLPLDTTKESMGYGSKHRLESRFVGNQNCQESKVLDSSNISFKINYTTSVEKFDDKPRVHLKQPLNFTPSKVVSEFKFEKHKLDDKNERVDEKISEISRKIKESELKKRHLGVDFVPFEKKASQLRFESPKCSMEDNFKSRTPECFAKKNSSSIEKLYSRPPKPADKISKFNEGQQGFHAIKQEMETHSPRFAPLPTEMSRQQPNYFPKGKPNLEVGLRNNKEDIARVQKNRSYSVYEKVPPAYELPFERGEAIEWEKNKEIVKKAEEAIRERKKKVDGLEEKKKSKENTQRLVQALCEQVKLDQKFRNCKLWFKAYKNQKKLARLRDMLELEGFRLDEQKIMEEFDVQEKEDNPFFSVSSQGYDIEEVARSYIASEKNWRKSLSKKFNKSAMEKEDFSGLSIDLDKKGYMVLEDLVRFLNMETGTFFRNRDLFSIFRRMSNNSDRISFATFINTFYA